MQESNSHGDGPGQGAQGVRDKSQRTWAEERQQLVSWVATAGAIWRWKGRWKRRTGFGTVGSLSLGWRVALVEAWVGIVDFAHEAYQSESGYEALLDETFRLGLGDWESDSDVDSTSDGFTRDDEWFPTMEWRASLLGG